MYYNGLYALKNTGVSESQALTESNAFVGIYQASDGSFKEIDKYIVCTSYLTPLYDRVYRSWYGYSRYVYSDGSTFSGTYYDAVMQYDLYNGTISIPMNINGTFTYSGSRYHWSPELPKGYESRDMYSEGRVVSQYTYKNYVSRRCYSLTKYVPSVNYSINLTGVIGYAGTTTILRLSRYVTIVNNVDHSIITVKSGTNGTFNLVIPPQSIGYNPVLYISRTEPLNYTHFITEVIHENYDMIGEKLFNIPLVGIMNDAGRSNGDYTSPTLLGLLPDSSY